MKKICFISIFLLICFISCDGRDRVYNSNTDNLEESKLSDSFFERITYIPKHNTIIVTDTILNSELRVNVKFYSLIDKGVAIKDENNHKFFRQFESEINVFKKGKLLFTDILNTNDFIETDNPSFWNTAILQFVWLEEFTFNEEQIELNCSFLKPNTNEYKSFKIYFNLFGERKIELIESS
ncbi:hypothetical protein JYT34_00850 [Olleya sp. AH-315-K02]|nr:hypothetical protein [Olleya sp. AH-315-K02]MBN4057972.1 hypothetical protein [Olleya sp. AH-315-K02]